MLFHNTMLRQLFANTLTTTGRKTKAVNYSESKDHDDGETVAHYFKS